MAGASSAWRVAPRAGGLRDEGGIESAAADDGEPPDVPDITVDAQILRT